MKELVILSPNICQLVDEVWMHKTSDDMEMFLEAHNKENMAEHSKANQSSSTMSYSCRSTFKRDIDVLMNRDHLKKLTIEMRRSKRDSLIQKLRYEDNGTVEQASSIPVIHPSSLRSHHTPAPWLLL